MSAYMKEDLLKRKFMATWQELCSVVGISPEIEITNESLTTGYTKTPYPEINRRVTRLLRCNEFPDHYDIVELIERCNTKHELGISAEEKAQLSRDVFKNVGKILKGQRARDFKAHFGSHLTDDALKKNEDPAASDATLLETLRRSLKDGQEKLEQLCEGFVVKQDMENEHDKSPEGDACETDDEAEEEEEEGEEEGESVEKEGESIEKEGEEEECTSTGVSKSDNTASSEPCELDIESGSESDDIEVEKVSSESSDDDEEDGDKNGEATPRHLAATDSSPLSSAGEEECADLPHVTFQSHNSDSDGPPQSKRIKLTHSHNTPNGSMDSERDAVSSSTGLGGKTQSLPRPSVATTTVILVDDDDSDSDVIVLSD